MLLFNKVQTQNSRLLCHFNTSNVTVQLRRFFSHILLYVHFNTSNVTVQHSNAVPSRPQVQISIHLMLLFNSRPTKYRMTYGYFNTSNVTVQPRHSRQRERCFSDFNTSNVTVQLAYQIVLYQKYLFQYI